MTYKEIGRPMNKIVLATGVFGLMSGAFAADTGPDLAARKLFYQDNQPEVVFKAVAVSAKPANLVPVQNAQLPPVKKSIPVKGTRPLQMPPNSDMLAAKAKEALASVVAGFTPDGTQVRRVQNLGVRYNIMKVNPATGDQVAVPSDSTFRKGDCVAIRMSPNRGGFLYVFNQATSGKWQPLIPSEDLPEEPTAVKPYQVISIPAQHCFEMDDPAGDERLFVMITEKPEDIKSIDDVLKKLGKPSGQPASPVARPDAMVLAMNNLSDTIQGFQGQLASRDIKITKVAQPISKMELPHTVFLVNAAATTNDHLIMEIKLKHN